MLKFSCTCQNYNGYLNVSAEECFFVSSLFRVEFKWSNVKKIKLDTKQIKGIPTSVLVIGLVRTVAADDDETSVPSSRRKRKKKSTSKKYFFYGFQDLLSAEERVKATWEHWKQVSATSARETARKESASGDSADGNNFTTARFADEVNSGGSTHVEPDTSSPSAPPPLPASRAAAASENRTPGGPSTGAKRLTPLTVQRRSGVDVLTPESGSTVKDAMERVLVVLARCVPSALHFLFNGGLVSAVVVAFLVCVSAVTVSQMRFSVSPLLVPGSADLFTETKSLLDSLQSAFAHLNTVGQYVSLEDYHRVNQRRQSAFDDSAAWVSRLERAARELAERFVLLQAELLNLRSRRGERFMAAQIGITSSAAESWRLVFQEGDRRQRKYYLADPSASSSEPSTLYDTGAAEDENEEDEDSSGQRQNRKQQRHRVLSLQRVMEDIDFWCRTVTRTASWVRRVALLGRGGGATGSVSDGGVRRLSSDLLRSFQASDRKGKEEAILLVRYSEPFLDGYDIVQYITPAEKAERQECLRITNELVKVSHLIQDVFLGFNALLMSSTYEKIATGVEKPHFWGSAPPPTSRLSAGNNVRAAVKGLPVFSSDEVLRVLFIRRFMEALQHLNPLEPNEHRRRADALAFSERLQEFTQRESELSRELNRTNKDALLELFADTVLPRSFDVDAGAPQQATSGIASTLRNVLEEVKFWDLHEGLWMEHLLHSLSQSHRSKLLELATQRKSAKKEGLWRRTDSRQGRAKSSAQDHSCESIHGTGSLDAPARCRQQLFWENLPTFKGLLCFTSQPRLRRLTDPIEPPGKRRTTAREERGSRRKSFAAAAPAEAASESSREAGWTPPHNATPAAAAGTTEPVGPLRRTTAVPAAAAIARNSTSVKSRSEQPSAARPVAAIAAAEETEAEPQDGAHVPPRTPFASRLEKTLTAAEEFRRTFDPSRVENTVMVVKERWMSELDMLLSSLSADSGDGSRRNARRRQRSFHLEQEDESVEPELAASRGRLLALIEKLNYAYLLPIHRSGSGFLRHLEKWCWPPSWFRADPQPELEAIRGMATTDPAVQLASARVAQIPWGTNRDAPLVLLKHVLLQPPELLKTRARIRNRIIYGCLLLVVSVVVLVVVYVFL